MKYMIQNSIISRGKGKKRREQGYDSMCMCVVWYGVRDMVERFFIF